MIAWFKALFRGSKSISPDYADSLALIKYLIKKKAFTDAIDELKTLLRKHPLKTELYLILADIYSNYLEKKSQTVKLIERYFSKNGIGFDADNIELILYYVDAVCALGQRGKAIHLITNELARNGYSEESIEQLKTTLKELKLPLDNNPFANPDFLKPAIEDYRPSKIGNRTTVFRQNK